MGSGRAYEPRQLPETKLRRPIETDSVTRIRLKKGKEEIMKERKKNGSLDIAGALTEARSLARFCARPVLTERRISQRGRVRAYANMKVDAVNLRAQDRVSF